eukprot:scaffold70314_cov25-Tisochrysis_lutea.AAC.2
MQALDTEVSAANSPSCFRCLALWAWQSEHMESLSRESNGLPCVLGTETLAVCAPILWSA